MRKPALVLKLGGELLEHPRDLSHVASGIVELSRHSRLVVVHGGGREIDAALATAGIAKIQVDGIRVTDAATLDVVVSVLAGAINTRLVSAVRKAGGRPVGLTGADADVATIRRAARFTTSTGRRISLGLVGSPIDNGAPQLLTSLLVARYVPIVACIGATRDGEVLNVNADTLAAHLAVAIRARRLIIAGGTPGVLDPEGRTIGRLGARAAAGLIKQGTANAGMIAKLQACRSALRGGVKDVFIVNGRVARIGSLAQQQDPSAAAGTQVVA